MRRYQGSLASLVLLASCSSGTGVALNERLFDKDSLISEGAGCDIYALGSNNVSGTSTTALGLTVMQHSDGGMHVTVDVSGVGGTAIADKTYDLGFFQSGAVDEFIVPTASDRTLLLKYWGSLDSTGTAGCSSLNDNGPPGLYDPGGATGDAGAEQ